MYQRWEKEIPEKKVRKVSVRLPAPPPDAAEPTVSRHGGYTTAPLCNMVAEEQPEAQPDKPMGKMPTSSWCKYGFCTKDEMEKLKQSKKAGADTVHGSAQQKEYHNQRVLTQSMGSAQQKEYHNQRVLTQTLGSAQQEHHRWRVLTHTVGSAQQQKLHQV